MGFEMLIFIVFHTKADSMIWLSTCIFATVQENIYSQMAFSEGKLQKREILNTSPGHC